VVKSALVVVSRPWLAYPPSLFASATQLILNVVTFGMSYLTVYLLLKIPAVAPFLGVKPPRRPSSSTLPRRNESYHSLSSPTS
jgi:hypothetical protein